MTSPPLLAEVAGDAGAGQQYFSPLESINAQTVSRLGLAWSYDLGTQRGQEATPVVVDGVMYTSGYIGLVYALDAATGRELWRFTPTIEPMSMRHACCDAVNRGVAVARARCMRRQSTADCTRSTPRREKKCVRRYLRRAAVELLEFRRTRHRTRGGGHRQQWRRYGTGGVRGYVSAFDLASGRSSGGSTRCHRRRGGRSSMRN